MDHDQTMIFETTTDLPTTLIDVDEYYSSILEGKKLLYRIFLEFYTVLACLCFAANIIIIYVIMKYKRLRNDKANVILLNWAVLNTFFIATQPTTLRIVTYWIDAWGNKVLCVVEQSQYTALFGNVLFIMLLFIYWFMKVYYPRKYLTLARNTKLSVGIIYIFLLFSLIVHIETCINRWHSTLAEIFLVLNYILFILFMIIMNITHSIKKRKLFETTIVCNVPFILCNIFFSSIIPLIIIIIIEFFSVIDEFVSIIFIFSALILAVLNPIYFFVVLYKCDKDFNTFFMKVFKCECKKYDDELIEEPVIFNGDIHM